MATPMFPLGTVLLPGMVLPLHVFEPRYRALVDDVGGVGGEFGVVLIERGSEVGGGDVRMDVGTVAKIVEAEEFDDGRWAIVTVGTARFRVDQWLPDDPYPRADVTLWPDAGQLPAPDRLATMHTVLDTLIELATMLGASVEAVRLPDDPRIATWHAATTAPLGPLDRQRLLMAESPTARTDLLIDQLTEQAELLRFQIT